MIPAQQTEAAVDIPVGASADTPDATAVDAPVLQGEPSLRHSSYWSRLAAHLRQNPRTLGSLVLTSVTCSALLILLLVQLQAAASGAGGNVGSPLVGHPAPDFTIKTWTWNDSTSVPVHLAAFKGHPVVVNFWASWCVACREEESFLEASWLKYQAQGVLFIGVAFEDTPQDGIAFLREYGVTFPSGPDTSGAIAISYGVTGVPETVFIDRRGVVRQKVIGALDASSLGQAMRLVLPPAA